MTVELFRSDPYRFEFVACVTGRDGDWISLDQTCFWPGDAHVPEHDTGGLGAYDVLAVQRVSNGSVQHLLAMEPDDQGPSLGARLVCFVDWERRYRRMRTHTALHLVELALRETHDVSGITLDPTPGGPPMLSFVLASGDVHTGVVSEWVADVVSDDLPVRVDWDPGEPDHRVWHIDGIGHRPCDGLHVWSTGEVGTVNVHKGGERGVRVELQLEVGEVVEFRGGV